jgi:antitoxin VapB
MVRTRLFRSNRSQAARLPVNAAFAAGVEDVMVMRERERRMIVRADAVWDDFFGAPGVDLGPRDQPEAQSREPFRRCRAGASCLRCLTARRLSRAYSLSPIAPRRALG